MAAPSNKSSSTPTISSRANFNSRNSELGNPMRRSFSGSPFAKPSIVANPRGFNPNTPANSPSDFSRRNSVGRESVVSSRDHEDKENTKDQNLTPGRVRSPASSSRGGKNFMSPTISAASKIAASPRKKILVDRNEPARTSVSLSSEKNPFRSVRFSDVVEDIDAKADTGLEENKIEASSDEKEGTFPASSTSEALRSEEVLDPETVTDEPATVTDEPDCVNLDPTFKISPTSSCSWSCPTLAPLDADPSMPPYDPKTNFLSPRPQFLHYRPNPRVESYLNEESDGRRLEESFSDTDVTEETQSEDSQKENEDVSSGEKVKEEVRVSEDVSSGEILMGVSSGEKVKEEQEEVRVSEDVSSGEILMGVSEPTPISTQLPKEKPQFFTRSKFIVLLLILSLAGLSFSVPIAPAVLKESNFFEIYGSSAITAKANLDGFARNFWLWYANSVSFVSELMPNFRGEHISGPLLYCNLTALSEDIPLDGYLLFDNSPKGNVLESFKEREVDIEPLQEEGQPELEVDEDDTEYEGQEIEEVSEEHGTAESEEVLQALEAEVTSEADEVLRAPEAEVIIQADNSEESEEVLQALKAEVTSEADEVLQAAEAEVIIQADNSEVKKMTQEEVVLVLAGNLDNEQRSNGNFQEQPVIVSKGEEIQSEVSEAVELRGESEMISEAVDENPESSELDASAENQQSSEVREFSINGITHKISRETVLGIALLVLALIAATAFIYMRKDKSTTTPPSAAINIEQPLLTKKLDSSPMSVSTEHIVLERRPSWPTEVDMVGESCPSEMSSFERSSSYSKKELKGSSEAQSQERWKPRNNYKRESLASSSADFSTGSPSYGSFTTYEKVPSKHGYGDEETIITPVRRSNRIRKQVTSP